MSNGLNSRAIMESAGIELLTVAEVAERLCVSETTAWTLVRMNTLPSIKIGRARRVPADVVEAYKAHVANEARQAIQSAHARYGTPHDAA